MKFWDSLEAHLAIMKMLVDCYLLSGIKLCTQCVTNKNWVLVRDRGEVGGCGFNFMLNVKLSLFPLVFRGNCVS